MLALDTEGRAPLFDGLSAEALAALLTLPRVDLFVELSSTLDIAHQLGEAGTPAGTLVIADAQTAGRGRMRRVWRRSLAPDSGSPSSNGLLATSR